MQSSNGPGWIISVIGSSLFTIIFTVVLVGAFSGREAMMSHWIETGAIALLALIGQVVLLYGPIYLRSVTRTVYEDHQRLAAELRAPRPICPTCPTPVVDRSLKPIGEWRDLGDRLIRVFSSSNSTSQTVVAVTGPEQNASARDAIFQLFVEGIRGLDSSKRFVALEKVPQPGGTDADIPMPSRSGVVIHCSDSAQAWLLTNLLQNWFVARSTEKEVPESIKKYLPKRDELNHWNYVWIEVGNGTVWK